MEDILPIGNIEPQPISTPISTSKKFNIDKRLLMFAAGGIIIGLLFGLIFSSSSITGAAVSTGDIESSLKTMFPQITVGDITDQGNLYAVNFTVDGAQGKQDGVLFITKDGKYLVPGEVIDMKALEDAQAEQNKEIPKTDKPNVELFVMSYCPYGLQMEKAFLPVKELLGKVADFKIRFVHYILHGEKEATENTRDYCIQKEEPAKFSDYLTCFIKNGKNSVDNTKAAEDCIASGVIDKVKIDKCMTDTTALYKITEALSSGASSPEYGVDAVASKEYGVEGSPTLVINGVIVENVARNPEAIKEAVCNAFNDVPDECKTLLSKEGFDAGFGLAASSADTTGAAAADASCA